MTTAVAPFVGQGFEGACNEDVLMVKLAEVTALVVMPLMYPMALIVLLLLTVIGPLYSVPTVELGVLPSVV